MKRNPVTSIAIEVYNLIPEGRLRHVLRVLGLTIRETLPRRVYVNEGDYVIQVGTPNPHLIEYYASIVGPNGRIVVLEPEEQNFQRLSSDEHVRNLPMVRLLQRAAWCRRERLNFIVSKDRFDHKVEVADVVHDNDYVPGNYTETMVANADTIDNVVDELGMDHVDFIEIHVNGAELEVLKGMKKTLPRTARIHVKGHAKIKQTRQPINVEIANILREYGFSTKITRHSVARQEARNWGKRAGDVYGARVT